MSDVLIKGMEMPRGCTFCKIARRNGKKMVCPLCDEEWDIHDPMSADHRLADCPLVPVPPHGRLIDADALMEEFRLPKDLLDPAQVLMHITGVRVAIQTAPTIIPAEEGET